MFTGLVEEIGTIASVSDTSKGFDLTIKADLALENVALGDSIAVNGVCLTVTAFTDTTFTVGLAPETRAKTSLAELQANSPVNLERAVLPTTRLGGHYVQGHVDGTGVIKSFRTDEDAIWVTIKTSPDLMKYVVSKGYIAIDGTSLTVVNTGADWFDVTLIRYTQHKIVLPRKKVGDLVNLEVDILAKYVERLLQHQNTAPSGVSRSALERAGFIKEGAAS